LAERTPARDALWVSVLYLTLFGSFGLYGPFVGDFLRQAGLSAASLPIFFAATRLVRVVSTPVWTAWVDTKSNARDALLVSSVPTALFFLWMLFSSPGLSWLFAYALFVILRGPSVSLCDVLAIDASARANTTYGKLRLWGTVGYCAGAFGAGALLERNAGRAVLALTLATTILGALSVQRLPTVETPKRGSYLADLRTLLSQRRYVLLLLCSSLHALGLATYDMLYGPWAKSHTNGTIAGLAIAVGGVAEVLFMLSGGPLLRWLGGNRALALAFAASAARWVCLARATSPVAIVSLQLLHAFTFGAYYLASIEIVERESPPGVRASAQGLFTTVSFGVAAAIALAVASPLIRRGGLALVFDVAAACALLAAAIAFVGLRERDDTRSAVAVP